jgi:hypothetical protein
MPLWHAVRLRDYRELFTAVVKTCGSGVLTTPAKPLSHWFAPQEFFQMSSQPSYLALESEYQTDHRTHEKIVAPAHRSSRPPKSNSRVKSFNGMHRRKAKRMSW